MTIAPAPPAALVPPAPPEAVDLLGHLRSPDISRPKVDAGLAGGLRAWLEDEAATRQRRGRLVVHDALSAGGLGTAALGSAREEGGVRRPDMAAGRTVEQIAEQVARMIFRLVVTDRAPLHPFEDALAALAVCEGGPALLEVVRRLPSSVRAELRASAHACATTTSEQWRRVPAAWLPRTGERLRATLGGGDVVLRATADLVLGRPSAGTASVCVVRVRVRDAGSARSTAADADCDARGLRFLALLETVRSGAAPLRVATYRPASGTLLWEEVTDTLLTAAVGDVAAAMARP